MAQRKPEEGLGGSTRTRIVDVCRGFAVFVMLMWHAADAWIAPGYRNTPWLWGRYSYIRATTRMTQANSFDWLQALGGTAAPMFFLLAGVSLGIAQGFREERYASFQRRFFHVICVGYGLKLWSFAVDRMGLLRPAEWVGIALCSGAIFSFHVGLSGAPDTTFTVRRFSWPRRNLLVLGTGSLAALLIWSRSYEAFRHRFGQLDVLQQMGLALLATNGFARLVYKKTSAPMLTRVSIGCALLICAVSQPMHDFPSDWPRAVTHWIVRRTGEPLPYFPLFPWAAYAFTGLAIGLWIQTNRTANGVGFALPHGVPATAALLVGAAGVTLFLDRSPFFVGLSWPWFWHISRLCFYLSFLIFFAGAFAWLGERWPRVMVPFEVIGQHSLLIYGVHLEFVFGLLGKPLSRSLSPTLYVAASAILAVMMYSLAVFWTRRASLVEKPIAS